VDERGEVGFHPQLFSQARKASTYFANLLDIAVFYNKSKEILPLQSGLQAGSRESPHFVIISNSDCMGAF
jgi:hypothetical protein